MLALYIDRDLNPECPFYQADLLHGIDTDMLRQLVVITLDLDAVDLRARVLDLAWLKRAVDHEHAIVAVNEYIQAAEKGINSVDPLSSHIVCTRLKRAIEIAHGLGAKQRPLFEKAVEAIEEAIDRQSAAEPLCLMQLLAHFRAGDAQKYADLAHEIAGRARRAYQTNGVQGGGDCEIERQCLEMEIVWRSRLKDFTAVRTLKLEVAQAFVRQADGVVEARWSSAKSVAEHFLGCAIKKLRDLGGEGERIDQLRLRQQVLQREAIAEMKLVSVDVDVTELVEASKAHVTGKSTIQALLALAFFHTPPSISALQEEVQLQARQSPLLSLIPRSFRGPRGTVIASHAGLLDQKDDTGLGIETMRVAHSRQSETANPLIHAMSQQIYKEHGLDTSWFIGLASASAFVPDARQISFGRGLAAGLRGDYELAATLLMAQFEHAVRELFFSHSIVVSTLPSDGVQNELDLNALLKHARAAEVFGEELLFDLRVLLTEKAGANLRNDLRTGCSTMVPSSARRSIFGGCAFGSSCFH